MYEIDKKLLGAFIAELRKKKDLPKRNWLKNCFYRIKPSANGKRE